MVAPLLPQVVQRARCRNRSLDSSAPQRITATAHANGAWCWHRSQCIHTQGVERRRSPSVGRGSGGDLYERLARQYAASFRLKLAGSPLMTAIERPLPKSNPAATDWGCGVRKTLHDCVVRRASASGYIRPPDASAKKEQPRRDIPGPTANSGDGKGTLFKGIVIAAFSEGLDPASKPRFRRLHCSSHIDLPAERRCPEPSNSPYPWTAVPRSDRHHTRSL
jgi:hypothetical protein